MRGRDTDLGRDLAVKVLLDEHKDKPHVVQRFIEEAQIGGQLQHPGIAPVYELGQFADQRPFFTMKLVKGKTLSALLEDRSSPDEDRAKFLGIFEQICQTMAYAHSRGVIHRDLKPSNIMVGAFGEVQVMDWGLAKVLSEGGVADEKRSIDKRTNLSIIQTIRSLGSDTPASFGSGSAGSHTQMGSVMGTPAYMPPEQALGEIDRLDQRSDVFGLGAILCEILTGQPPYTGENHTEVFRKASRAKLDDCFSELESQNVDAELMGIVRGTLAPEPEDRIRDASVLTERVSNHLASLETRMRAAELAKVEANTKATEERKRRKVMMALAASVLLTMGVGGAGWLYSKQKDFALRQAEADAERQKQIDRLEDRQRFLAEVTTAESLLAESNTVLPTQIAIQEAQSAIERVEAAGGPSDELDLEDKQRFESARDTVTQLAADRRLLESLQSCWQYENEYEAARRLSLLDSEESEVAGTAVGQDSNMIQNLDDAPKAIAELASPAEKYESAFSDWGLRLSDEDAAKQFSRMHPNVLPAAFVSLDRWRERLVFSRSLDEWREEPWSTLKPLSLKSRGGDRLEVLEDLSILASGDNPHMGYELKFETDVTTLTALRLEALTHESLPNNGPGRSNPGESYKDAIGIFSLQGIEVWYAPRARPQDRRRLWLQSAVADYSYNYSTVHSLTTESWMVGRGSGKDHEAVFESRDSPTDASGFLIFISHADRAPGLWGGENIGRFRWSVPGKVDGREQANLLAKLSEEVDTDAWRAELRSEIERNDLAALVDRTRNHEQLEQQPLVSQFQLIDALVENKSGGTLLRFINRDSNWQAKPATSTQIASTEVYRKGFSIDPNISIERLDDGSYSIDGSYPVHEHVELIFDWSERVPTAVKLELIPEKRDGNLAFGRSDSGWVDLVDLSVGVRSQSKDENENAEFEDIPIYGALSDLPTHRPLRLWATFDGKRRTYSPLFDSGNQHQIVYLLNSDASHAEALSADKELRIKLETTRHFARFRLSFSTDDFEVPDAKEEALDLARFVCEQNPDQYWAQVKLANTCLAQNPQRFDEAMSHAMAAYALEPDNPSSSNLLLKATSIDRLAEDESLQRATIFALKSLAANATGSGLPKEHIKKIGTTAVRLIKSDPDKAIKLFRFILDARPDDPIVLNNVAWTLGFALVDAGIRSEVELGIRTYHRLLELDPKHSWANNNLGAVYFWNNQLDKALEYYNKQISLNPDSGITYANIATTLEWEPTDNLKFSFDAIINDQERSQDSYRIQ
ncbi:MAG: protein kinase, partial [Planctomycetota bacterium]